MYAMRDARYTELDSYNQRMNTLQNEAYLQDLSDEKDFRTYYVTRLTQVIAQYNAE
jgi:alpha-galactosidase/6-phospho-beta-glucosidase family protein